MITASELVEKRLKDVAVVMDEIENKILQADSRGNRNVIYYLTPNSPHAYLIQLLNEHGFGATMECDEDRITSTKYLKITWS